MWIESGLAAIPFLMQRLDSEYMMRSSEAPLLKRKSSGYIQDMFYSSQPLERSNMDLTEATFKAMKAESQCCSRPTGRTANSTCRIRSPRCRRQRGSQARRPRLELSAAVQSRSAKHKQLKKNGKTSAGRTRADNSLKRELPKAVNVKAATPGAERGTKPSAKLAGLRIARSMPPTSAPRRATHSNAASPTRSPTTPSGRCSRRRRSMRPRSSGAIPTSYRFRSTR